MVAYRWPQKLIYKVQKFHNFNYDFMEFLSLHVWHQELRKAINIIITGVLEVVQGTTVDPWNYSSSEQVQAVNANVIGQYRIESSSVRERETRPKHSSSEPD